MAYATAMMSTRIQTMGLGLTSPTDVRSRWSHTEIQPPPFLLSLAIDQHIDIPHVVLVLPPHNVLKV